MKDLAITFRAAQLTAHNMHNSVLGPTFFEDHEFLGELYGVYEAAYDGIVERMIGLDLDINLSEVTKQAGAKASNYDVQKMRADEMFSALLAIENYLQGLIAKLDKEEQTVGMHNFLQGLADESEVRTYKLRQRTKSPTGIK